MEEQKLTPEVFIRLLVAKGLLDQIRFNPTAQPDRVTLARHILTAHDAAELAVAAIAQQLDKLPRTSQNYLMNYIASIKEIHPEKDVPGRDYFSQLNEVRINIKHQGIFPDPQQWYRVGERTWEYVSGWCQAYLGRSLEDLDESSLISTPDVKKHYDSAVDAFRRNNYKETLEHLALATEALFNSNRALRNLSVGVSQAEDAIKLAAFGVHANNYLALQEFLPRFSYDKEYKRVIKWEQAKYGHHGNWREDTAAFCLKTFLEVALRIQHADWIPGAVEYDVLYDYKITAIVDDVEITKVYKPNFWAPEERSVVKKLKRGESLTGLIIHKDDSSTWLDVLAGEKTKPTISFFDRKENFSGEVNFDQVRITCVPKDNKVVREYFPDLPEIDYEP